MIFELREKTNEKKRSNDTNGLQPARTRSHAAGYSAASTANYYSASDRTFWLLAHIWAGSRIPVKMTAPSVMTIVLIAADGATALIALDSSAIITAVALGATTARLRGITTSKASTIIVTRLLLAVLLGRIVSFVLALVFGHLLILEVYAPVTMEIVAEFVRIQRIVWIKRINRLVVRQPILHLFGENVPNKL